MRLFILLCITFLHQLSSSLSYDLEIEGSIKLVPEFLEMFKQDQKRHRSSKKITKIDKASNKRQFKAAEDQSLAKVNKLKKQLSSDESDYTEIRNTDVAKPKISNVVSIDNDFVSDIKSQLYSEGTLKLLSLGDNIKKNMLHEMTDVNPDAVYVSKDYTKEINSFFEELGKPKPKYAIEREFYVLHIIESANEIFANKCNLLLDNTIKQLQINQTSNLTNVRQHIQEVVNGEKKSNLKFICKKFDVCKTFPAFSDFIADLLKEIINLKDRQLKRIVNILKKYVIDKKNAFFTSIIDADTAKFIDTKSQMLTIDVLELRNFLHAITHFISHKYKMYKNKDGELNVKSRAIRILIDMIDTAFGKLGEDFIIIEFDNLFRDIQDMKNNPLTSDIQTALKDFVSSFEEVLGYYWVPQFKDEVKILTKVIMTGTSDDEAARELLTKGSKFVMGKINTSELDKKLPLLA